MSKYPISFKKNKRRKIQAAVFTSLLLAGLSVAQADDASSNKDADDNGDTSISPAAIAGIAAAGVGVVTATAIYIHYHNNHHDNGPNGNDPTLSTVTGFAGVKAVTDFADKTVYFFNG